jgi:spore germination protein KB
MLDNGRISSVQLFFILLILEGASALLYAPRGVAALSGPDGWLAVSLGDLPYGLAILLVAVGLAKRFPVQTFAAYLPQIMGRILGKLLSAVYVIGFIFFVSYILSQGLWFLRINYYTHTPGIVIAVVLAVVAIYGAYLGIEVVARETGLALIGFYAAIFLLFFLSAKEIDLGNLRPVLENGLLPVLRAAIFHSTWRANIFFGLMFYPYLNQKQEALKTGLWFLGIVTIMAINTHAVIVGVFGSLATAQMNFPFERLIRYISLAGFIERLETVFMIFLIGAIISKLAIAYHMAGTFTAETLGLKNYRVTLLPIAAASVVVCELLFGTFSKVEDFQFRLAPVTAVMVLAIPALILLIAVIRKKRADPGKA